MTTDSQSRKEARAMSNAGEIEALNERVQRLEKSVREAADLLRERPAIGGDEYENLCDEWLADFDELF